MREVKTYSEAFKHGIAGKPGQGLYTSLSGADRRNGIRGNGTLPGRLRKYEREDLLPKRVKAGTMSETGELKAARKEIREPKGALADANTGWCSGSAFSGIACGQPRTTAAELKKIRCDASGCAKDKGAKMSLKVNAMRGRHGMTRANSARPAASGGPGKRTMRGQDSPAGEVGGSAPARGDGSRAAYRAGNPQRAASNQAGTAFSMYPGGGTPASAASRPRAADNELPSQPAGVPQPGEGHGTHRSESGTGGGHHIHPH